MDESSVLSCTLSSLSVAAFRGNPEEERSFADKRERYSREAHSKEM